MQRPKEIVKLAGAHVEDPEELHSPEVAPSFAPRHRGDKKEDESWPPDLSFLSWLHLAIDCTRAVRFKTSSQPLRQGW
jgi:hypothetical protein